jgi:hypothetical protein
VRRCPASNGVSAWWTKRAAEFASCDSEWRLDLTQHQRVQRSELHSSRNQTWDRAGGPKPFRKSVIGLEIRGDFTKSHRVHLEIGSSGSAPKTITRAPFMRLNERVRAHGSVGRRMVHIRTGR